MEDVRVARASACMHAEYGVQCPPLAPTRGNESNGKRRRKGERIEGKRETVRGKGRKECDRERAGREGEGEICGSVNHGKDACRPGGCCSLDFCPRNEKPGEEHGQLGSRSRRSITEK